MQNITTGNAFDLQLFADGAAAEAQAVPAETIGRTGSSRRFITGEVQSAGETASPAASPAAGETENTGEPTPEEKRKAFRALIQGEYREQYAELFQNAFNRRFRESREMESRLKRQQAVLDTMARRCRVPEGDLDALQAALDAPDGQRNAREEARQRQAAVQRQVGRQLTGWLREAGALRSRYPAFDLRAELADSGFRTLLRSGVPLGQAYELRHLEEIKAHAARTAGEQTVQRIRSRGLRPVENGISQQGAVITKNDVHSLTPAQRREIARRVQRGDRIRF